MSGSWPISFALYDVVVVAVEVDLDLGGLFDDVVVGEDEAVFADDEAGARRLRLLLALRAGVARPCG